MRLNGMLAATMFKRVLASRVLHLSRPFPTGYSGTTEPLEAPWNRPEMGNKTSEAKRVQIDTDCLSMKRRRSQ